MSFLTCFWLLPQNEHLSRSPLSPMRATGSFSSLGSGTTVVAVGTQVPDRALDGTARSGEGAGHATHHLACCAESGTADAQPMEAPPARVPSTWSMTPYSWASGAVRILSRSMPRRT